MTTTIEIDQSLIESELFPLVDSWLLLKTRADIIRAKVDEVYNEILRKTPVYVSDEFAEMGAKKERIFQHDQLYLAENETARNIFAEARRELSKTYDIEGIKDEPFYCYKCPALVAENEVTGIEHLIIKCVGRMTRQDDFFDGVMSNFHNTYHKVVDLTIKLVVNHPKYENPLTSVLKSNKFVETEGVKTGSTLDITSTGKGGSLA